MKVLALFVLTAALFVTLLGLAPAELSNTTVALALMIVLLAVFADLKEFNFWGISGKKKEDDIKKLQGASLINEDTELQPSPYKLRKANKDDTPNQMERLPDNFLALAYEIERLLRIIARSIMRSTEETAELSPDKVLHYLEDEELLTPEACEAIEAIREIRTLLVHNNESHISLPVLESTYALSISIHKQLKNWIEGSGKEK